jgi:hypothetical protein
MIVVDDEDSGSVDGGHVLASMGKANWNIVLRPEFGVAQRRPPWDSHPPSSKAMLKAMATQANSSEYRMISKRQECENMSSDRTPG